MLTPSIFACEPVFCTGVSPLPGLPYAETLSLQQTLGGEPLPLQQTTGAPHLARTPDFLPCKDPCGPGCGFLLRKATGRLLEQRARQEIRGFGEMWDTTNLNVIARKEP